MTPRQRRIRRIRRTAQARAIRAGIRLARQHLAHRRNPDFIIDQSGRDETSRLFARAYIRTKIRDARNERTRRRMLRPAQ